MGRSLRSFPFYAKEWDVLYVLFRSFEKNGKERNILNGKERGAQPWIVPARDQRTIGRQQDYGEQKTESTARGQEQKTDSKPTESKRQTVLARDQRTIGRQQDYGEQKT